MVIVKAGLSDAMILTSSNTRGTSMPWVTGKPRRSRGEIVVGIVVGALVFAVLALIFLINAL